MMTEYVRKEEKNCWLKMEDGKNVDRNFVDIEVDVNSINVHLDNL